MITNTNTPQNAEPAEKTRILVMDDEQGILDLLNYELTMRGYAVTTALNGEEGIARMKAEKYHVVVSDVKMPRLNGIKALEIIKSIDPAVEVIMTTGYGTIDLAVECMKKGAYDFLNKPYNLDELCSRIVKALEKQKLTTELISLKELNRLKSEFLATTSHELRTPLNAIVGYVSLMLDRVYGDVTEKQANALQRINTNAGSLLQLINNILDISKLAAGKVNLFLEEFSVNDLLREIISMTDGLAQEKRLFLRLEDDGEITVFGDRTRLKQVLINLLGNAVKFTSTGGVTVRLKLRREEKAAAARDFVSIEVRDTGIGITPNFLPLLFEEFRQADTSTTREHGGTGLGLAIAKKLVELMDGTIDVESVPGQGSAFTVAIPVRLMQAQKPASPAYPASGVPADDRKLILAIDDDPEVHKLMRDSLEGTDFSFAGAIGGDDGIALAKQLRPFAITLDILMPGRDGWAVLQSLKSDPATWSIPVIILSVMENKSLAFSLGAADYLSKPFARRQLLERLNKLTSVSDRRILLVDDDRELNLVLQSLLTNAGYQVNSAFSGEEAMITIEKERPDAVVLDLLLPPPDGFAILERIRANQELASMKVIIMTGRALSPDEQETLHRRSALVLEKETRDIKDIIELIKKHVEGA